jgi:DNA-binding MarR family transcriptional regulator
MNSLPPTKDPGEPPAPASKPDPGSQLDQIVADLVPLIARDRAARLRRWCHQPISMTHLHVLIALEAEGPLSMSRLADLLDVSLPSATGIVGRMEERGLVRREHDASDRRVVLAVPTAAGREVVQDREFMHVDMVRRVLAEMASDERDSFSRGLHAFLTVLGELNHRDEPGEPVETKELLQS